MDLLGNLAYPRTIHTAELDKVYPALELYKDHPELILLESGYLTLDHSGDKYTIKLKVPNKEVYNGVKPVIGELIHNLYNDKDIQDLAQAIKEDSIQYLISVIITLLINTKKNAGLSNAMNLHEEDEADLLTYAFSLIGDIEDGYFPLKNEAEHLSYFYIIKDKMVMIQMRSWQDHKSPIDAINQMNEEILPEKWRNCWTLLKEKLPKIMFKTADKLNSQQLATVGEVLNGIKYVYKIGIICPKPGDHYNAAWKKCEVLANKELDEKGTIVEYTNN